MAGGSPIRYMVDCFFPDKDQFDGFRRESFTIKASSDFEAINVAKRAAFGRKSHHFHVCAVARKSDVIVYRSENA
jgi:hypothetical protein